MRQGAGEQLIDRGAQGIQIAARRGWRAGQLLGRHVGRRSGHDPGAGLRTVTVTRQPEVDELDGVACPIDEDIGRFDVAVNDALAMRERQGLGHAAHTRSASPSGNRREILV